MCVFYSHSLASFCDICVAKSFFQNLIGAAMPSGAYLGANDNLSWGRWMICVVGEASVGWEGGCARRNGWRLGALGGCNPVFRFCKRISTPI